MAMTRGFFLSLNSSVCFKTIFRPLRIFKEIENIFVMFYFLQVGQQKDIPKNILYVWQIFQCYAQNTIDT